MCVCVYYTYVHIYIYSTIYGGGKNNVVCVFVSLDFFGVVLVLVLVVVVGEEKWQGSSKSCDLVASHKSPEQGLNLSRS